MSGTRESRKCHQCGGRIRYARKNYRYTSAGLKNVMLLKIRVGKCQGCGEEYPEIPHMAELHELLAQAIVEKPTDLVGDELRYLRKVFDLSVKELAQEWGAHPVTMYKWETGEETITPQIDRLYRLYFIRKGIEKFGWEPAKMKLNFAGITRRPMHPPLSVDVEREEYEYVGRAGCRA